MTDAIKPVQAQTIAKPEAKPADAKAPTAQPAATTTVPVAAKKPEIPAAPAAKPQDAAVGQKLHLIA